MFNLERDIITRTSKQAKNYTGLVWFGFWIWLYAHGHQIARPLRLGQFLCRPMSGLFIYFTLFYFCARLQVT
jgi:hypothetical protein